MLALLAVAGAPSVTHMQLSRGDRESEFPSLAWNGSSLGAAWMDGRDGNLEIYFRAAAMDTRSGGPEVRVTHSADWDDHPRIVWTGSEFGLTWVHERKTKFDLMFATLNESGGVIKKPRNVVAQSWLGKDTALCWTGAGFGVVASQYQGSDTAQLVFRYVDSSGVTQGSPVTLTQGPGVKIPAELLRCGTDFGLLYLDSMYDSVHCLRVDPFGQPRGASVRLNLQDTRCGFPAASVGSASILATWPQKMETGSQVMVVPLSVAGEPQGVPFPVTQPGPERPEVALAPGPQGFGIAWIEITNEGRMLFFRRLDDAGQPVAEPLRLSKPRPVKIMSNRLTMSVDHAGFVIAWVDVAPPMNTEVILSRVSF